MYSKKEHEQKKHDHSHSHGGEKNSIRLLAVIIFNLIITVAEYTGGVISGSLALISDAGHNFSDVISLILGYAGEELSRRERNGRYTFGLKRFEVLAALINSITLIAIGIFIFNESVGRFINPQPVDLRIMLPVALIGLAGNFFSILVLHKGHDHNLNMRAAMLHMLFDAISSVAVIVAGVIIYFTSHFWVDIVMSCFIGIMIIWSALGILRESMRIFLQGVPERINTGDVYEKILAVEGVVSLHGLHIWSINSKEIFLSCHVCINHVSTGQSDMIIRRINAMLDSTFGINHSAVQVEFGKFCGIDSENCCR